MIFDQSICAPNLNFQRLYRNSYLGVKRQTVFDYRNNDVMEDAERTPFGRRLYDARTYAKLTQDQAAKAIGMAQGTLAEAEVSGKRSGYTVQLAALYKVDAGWLATGKGRMHQGDDSVITQAIAPALERDPMEGYLAALSKEDADAWQARIELAKAQLNAIHADIRAAAKREQRPAKRIRGTEEPERRIDDTGTYHKRIVDTHITTPQPGKKGVKK